MCDPDSSAGGNSGENIMVDAKSQWKVTKTAEGNSMMSKQWSILTSCTRRVCRRKMGNTRLCASYSRGEIGTFQTGKLDGLSPRI